MLRPRFTTAFRRDRKRVGRRGKDLQKLDSMLRRLVMEERLEPRYRDHKLAGEWQDCRDCHIEPDWILIYLAAGGDITFIRTDTHAELFGE